MKLTRRQLRLLIHHNLNEGLDDILSVSKELKNDYDNFIKDTRDDIKHTVEDIELFLLDIDKAMPDVYTEGFLIVFGSGIGILLSKWGLKYLTPVGLMATWKQHHETIKSAFKNKGVEAAMDLYVELFKNL